jgi:hypothetical protein
MGTAHNPKSTRASRERSVRSTPKPPRTLSGTPRATRLHRSKPADRAAAALRATLDAPPAVALQKIQDRLELIRSSVVVVAHALREQNCELDDDAARVLGYHVTDALTEQMVQIGLLLYKPGDEFGGAS